MKKFLFIDDEWSYMLVEWTTYNKFRKEFDKMVERIAKTGEEYCYFYAELEKKLKCKIEWLDFYSY